MIRTRRPLSQDQLAAVCAALDLDPAKTFSITITPETALAVVLTDKGRAVTVTFEVDRGIGCWPPVDTDA